MLWTAALLDSTSRVAVTWDHVPKPSQPLFSWAAFGQTMQCWLAKHNLLHPSPLLLQHCIHNDSIQVWRRLFRHRNNMQALGNLNGSFMGHHHHLVKMCIERRSWNIFLWFCRHITVNDDITCAVIKQGELDILKKLHQGGLEFSEKESLEAANSGHLHIIQWLHDCNCPWHPDVCQGAARNGHLELVKWAFKHGCSWNQWITNKTSTRRKLSITTWARQFNCSFVKYSDVCQHAPVKEWIHANNLPCSCVFKPRFRVPLDDEES